MTYDLVKVATETDWHAYHAIRRQVLWEAKGRNGYDESRSEEHRAANHPLLLKRDRHAIGTTRLDDLGDRRGVVRLVAIAAGLHRQGHGRVMSTCVEDYARRLDLHTLLVNADPTAVGFYRKTGWHPCVWDETELVGIAADCTQMMKTLVLKS